LIRPGNKKKGYRKVNVILDSLIKIKSTVSDVSTCSEGSKFGADYLVYQGDPIKFHAKYIVICTGEQLGTVVITVTVIICV